VLTRIFPKRAAIILAASVTLGTACNERAPSAPPGPSASPVELAPALSSIVITTTWDFVALAGGDGDQGTPKTFTVLGAGSVTATSTPTSPFPSSVTTKGFSEVYPSNERGLGICKKGGVGNTCAGSDEIGTSDGSGQFGSLILDFTALAPGSVVTDVLLSSVQLGEGYSVSWSADGITYTLLATGTGASLLNNMITISGVPATTKFLRFDVGPGAFRNDYVVESVTTVTTPRPPPPGKQGCTAGYWKQDQHFGSWVATGYTTGQLLGSVFTVPGIYVLNGTPLGNYTFLQALSFSSGNTLSEKAAMLMRNGVAALLNAGSIAYPLTTAQIISQVNAALASGDKTTIANAASALDALNNGIGGCPLN